LPTTLEELKIEAARFLRRDIDHSLLQNVERHLNMFEIFGATFGTDLEHVSF
jgi:hypothetical protein